VNKPNVFAVTGPRYILDMLMMAEGLTKEAGNICYVIRPTLKSSPAERSTTMVIDLDELLVGGNLSLNIPVFAGDAIHVPRGGLVFVDGSVKVPGRTPSGAGQRPCAGDLHGPGNKRRRCSQRC